MSLRQEDWLDDRNDVELFPGRVSRRRFLEGAGIGTTAALAAACAPAASLPPTASSPGDREWGDLVAAAKGEGKLVVVTGVGEGYRRVLEVFEAAFPGITTEQTTMRGSLFTPRAIQEYQAGIYSFDAMVNTFGNSVKELIPAGVIQPVRTVLVRPDVLDDGVWRDGAFDQGFLDTDKKWVYGGFNSKSRGLWVNKSMVREGEITKFEDLLNPKWKGKIISVDPRSDGGARTIAASLRRKFGDDVIRRFWKEQEIVISRDKRLMLESLIKGGHAVAVVGGGAEGLIADFDALGLTKGIQNLELEHVETAGKSTHGLVYFSRPPHPNAGKLFLNWLLTKEGSELYSKEGGTNSRRVDVPPAFPELLPTPGRSYFEPKEETWAEEEEVVQIARQVLS